MPTCRAVRFLCGRTCWTPRLQGASGRLAETLSRLRGAPRAASDATPEACAEVWAGSQWQVVGL